MEDGSTFNTMVLPPWRITRDRDIFAQAYSTRRSYRRPPFTRPDALYANEADLTFTGVALMTRGGRGADFGAI